MEPFVCSRCIRASAEDPPKLKDQKRRRRLQREQDIHSYSGIVTCFYPLPHQKSVMGCFPFYRCMRGSAEDTVEINGYAPRRRGFEESYWKNSYGSLDNSEKSGHPFEAQRFLCCCPRSSHERTLWLEFLGRASKLSGYETVFLGSLRRI